MESTAKQTPYLRQKARTDLKPLEIAHFLLRNALKICHSHPPFIAILETQTTSYMDRVIIILKPIKIKKQKLFNKQFYE